MQWFSDVAVQGHNTVPKACAAAHAEQAHVSCFKSYVLSISMADGALKQLIKGSWIIFIFISDWCVDYNNMPRVFLISVNLRVFDAQKKSNNMRETFTSTCRMERFPHSKDSHMLNIWWPSKGLGKKLVVSLMRTCSFVEQAGKNGTFFHWFIENVSCD